MSRNNHQRIMDSCLRAGMDVDSMSLNSSASPAIPATAPVPVAPMLQPAMNYNVPVGTAPAPVPAAAQMIAQPSAVAPVAAPAPAMHSDTHTAVMQERQRIVDISALAAPAQAQLAQRLINEGASVGDAAVALLRDRNSQATEAPATATPTPQLVAQQAAALLQANVPIVPATTPPEQGFRAQYESIKDPAERGAFFQAHRNEITTEYNRKPRS